MERKPTDPTTLPSTRVVAALNRLLLLEPALELSREENGELTLCSVSLGEVRAPSLTALFDRALRRLNELEDGLTLEVIEGEGAVSNEDLPGPLPGYTELRGV